MSETDVVESKNVFHYGVAVGINQYPAISDLSYAVSDAEAFYNWLINPEGGGVPEDNAEVVCLNGASGQQNSTRAAARPDKAMVLEAVYDKIAKAEREIQRDPTKWKDTRLYVYVSGHGIAPTAGEAALLMANAGPDWYGENLGTRRLVDCLEARQPFKEIVVFADCCRERVSNAPVGGVPWDEREHNNGRVKILRWLATGYGLESYEPAEMQSPDDQRGFFTKALIEGLEGAAITNSQQHLDCDRLANYVAVRMRELTNNAQIPSLPTDKANQIKFKGPSKAESVCVLISFPEGFNQPVKLLDGSLDVVPHAERYEPENGPWRIRLRRGLYRVVGADGEEEMGFAANGLFRVVSGDEHVTL